jgi:hypothetical protein
MKSPVRDSSNAGDGSVSINKKFEDLTLYERDLAFNQLSAVSRCKPERVHRFCPVMQSLPSRTHRIDLLMQPGYPCRGRVMARAFTCPERLITPGDLFFFLGKPGRDRLSNEYFFPLSQYVKILCSYKL